MIDRYEQLSFYIGSIYRAIHKIEKDVMQKHGLRGSYAQYLVAMSRYPEGITASRLCELCDKDKAATSRVIAEMEELGLISRNGFSAYRATLQLTDKGKEIAQYVLHNVKVAVIRAGEGLNDTDRKTFYDALKLIEGNLRDISKDGLE